MRYIRQKWVAFKAGVNSNQVIAVFTVVIALTGIIYTFFAAMQWSEMRKATIATQRAADAAHISAEALRPRLAVSLLTPAPLTANGLPMDTNRLHVQFQVPDYGPLPAENVQICEFDTISAPSRIARSTYGNCRSSSEWGYGSPVIPPINTMNGQAPGWGMNGSTTLTKDAIEGLKRGDLEATFSVLASYADAAGKIHHTEACINFIFQQKWGVQTIGSWGSQPCPWQPQND